MKNILLGITGSIAAFKACELIGMFKKKGYSVRCVMSKDAEKFITPLTVETLSGKKAAYDMFELQEDRCPAHISIADEADIILIAPATANVIGEISSGICRNVLTCSVFAATCPVLFAPAMNDKMFDNSIVQENIKRLKKNGYYFIDPVEGDLACGRKGKGHFAPVDKIVEETEKILTS
ncbi:MAG: phosphopantothenoylcysteine decarboxylase [Candidatus Omnitrophica bacterium]|nr:phosphopantothenoylcysteine decarboxylase [Candidatus Omnitrophota bacterium]